MLDVSFLKRPRLSVNLLLVMSLVYILTVDNQKFWSTLIDALDLSLFSHILFIAAFFMLLFTVTLILLFLVSNRKLLKPVLMVLLMVAATISYFMDTYGTVISVSMLHNIAETDYSEATDLLTSGLFLHIFIFGMVPAALVAWVDVQYKSLSTELVSRFVLATVCVVISATAIFASTKDFAYVVREHRQLRLFVNPLYPLTAVYKFAKESVVSKDNTLKPVFSDAKQRPHLNSKNTVLVMVVGETARASSFHLNGYQRNTTPQLEKDSGHVINFEHAYSCGTATAESVPCMFSVLDHDHFSKDEARHSENLLDGLVHAGVSVLWEENDGSCKGVCQRVETQTITIDADAVLCNDEKCFDEVLLSGLSDRLNTINNDTVIVLHQQGSHGPAYYKRYPDRFEVFKPACKTKAVQDCTQEEIINAYDNTILYTDYVLSEVINVLKQKSDKLDTAMLYMSDHGESLGENGLYLHGLPYYMAPDEQVHVPLVMWLSEELVQTKHVDMACLQEHGHLEKYSHDNLVHTVLGLMDIQTSQYDVKQNILSSCNIASRQPEVASFSRKSDHKI
ncbi:MAG: phosphoethanolamine--lipid A transferase [Gammaproteobacteria bacterium]|nr:phosphoethanolamine--lipid A transferase [Gammaproteobacteria bacterium]